MKNDVDVEVEMAANSVSVQAAGKRNKKKVGKLAERAARGDTMTRKILGQEVHFTLEAIPHDKVEMKTMPWCGNERDQELLDEFALAFMKETMEEDGQEFPAIGRNVSGIIDVADGTSRRMGCILFKQTFYVWVGDLNNEQMEHLSSVGNQYRQPSAYEKGVKYTRILKKAEGQQQAADSVRLSRKAFMRYVNTAGLPKEFIKSLKSPNDLSATQGENLYRVYRSLSEGQKEEVVEFCKNWMVPKKGENSFDEQVEQFTTKCQSMGQASQPKPAPETKPLHERAHITMKNGTANIQIKKISDSAREQIEEAIIRILDQEALDNF